MEFIYTKNQGRIRIDRIREPEAVIEIPETMEGYPVTEMSAYVLAESDVEEVHLPSRLEKIGAYAFYRCEKLRRLYCYGMALDLGAGLFAGSQNMEFLDITLFAGEKSCLKELLSELHQTLRVRIHELQNGEYEENTPAREARLIFPEYYEESVENTPARILVIETHGCGHRYRYCFIKNQFQYHDYDELFPHVQVQEPEELVTELALCRLIYPCGLTESHAAMYKSYVAEHWLTAGKLLIGMHRQDPCRITNLEAGYLPWLVENVPESCHFTTSGLSRVQAYVNLAQAAGDTETVSWLMDYQRKYKNRKKDRVQKKRRFEL